MNRVGDFLRRRRYEPVPTLRRGPQFVITGSGRCGTGFYSHALTAAGIGCGHEQQFTLQGVVRSRRFVGDASWLAIPELSGFPGPVIHLVRSPVEVMRSFLQLGFFDDELYRGNPYRTYALEHVFDYRIFDNQVDRSAAWWIETNARIESNADLRVRLEDGDLAVEQAVTFLTRRGIRPRRDLRALPGPERHDPQNEKSALKRRADGFDDVSIESVTDEALRRRLVHLASSYGYRVAD